MEDAFTFRNCDSGRFNYNFDLGDYDRDKPICHDPRVKARGMFPTTDLCPRSTVVDLKGNTGYCRECDFHSERKHSFTSR